MNNTTTPQTSLQVFDFGGEPVRTTDRNGEPWFVAADVCRVLEIVNPTQAVESLESDEKDTCPMQNIDQLRLSVLISESGLYALIFRSRKPKAQDFRRWVTQEVLPAIRRSGAYSLAAATAPPAQVEHPVEHPAVQFITVLDAIRARGASTEKILYSLGNLFQSSLAGAYQSNRQVLPMTLPPPPVNLPVERPTATAKQQTSRAREADGWESVSAFLRRHRVYSSRFVGSFKDQAAALCRDRGVEPHKARNFHNFTKYLRFPTEILEEILKIRNNNKTTPAI